MTSPDGQNGRPSENGTGPDRGQEKVPDKKLGGTPTGPEVTLLINDRLDALERAVGTVRRRQMSLRISSLTRRDDHLVLVFCADVGSVIPERWVAELGALVDVRSVDVAGPSVTTR